MDTIHCYLIRALLRNLGLAVIVQIASSSVIHEFRFLRRISCIDNFTLAAWIVVFSEVRPEVNHLQAQFFITFRERSQAIPDDSHFRIRYIINSSGYQSHQGFGYI